MKETLSCCDNIFVSKGKDANNPVNPEYLDCNFLRYVHCNISSEKVFARGDLLI